MNKDIKFNTDLLENEKLVDKTVEEKAASPLFQKAGVDLVAGARKMYAEKRKAIAAKGVGWKKLGEAAKTVAEDVEKRKQEERLKEEKDQKEADRVNDVLDKYIYDHNATNIDQHGTEMYNNVNDELEALKQEYLDLYELDPKNKKGLNEIDLRMKKLSGSLKDYSAEKDSYKTNTQEGLYSDSMDDNTKNLQSAYYTGGETVTYDGTEYTFSKQYVDGAWQMVLDTPGQEDRISHLEKKKKGLLERQSKGENVDEYLANVDRDLGEIRKVINPKDQFSSSNVIPKVDDKPLANLFNSYEVLGSQGGSINMNNVVGSIQDSLKTKNAVLSFANDRMTNQGKSMKEHFEIMFPDGIDASKEGEEPGTTMVSIEDLFSGKAEGGIDLLRELATDYYSRIAVNRFNQNKSKKASVTETSEGQLTNISTEEEGNEFRQWVNDKYPEYAREIDLDTTGSNTNAYITEAWNTHGEEFKKYKSEQRYDDLVTKYIK